MARYWDARSFQRIASEDNKRLCPDCKAPEIVFQGGENYCKKCGYVL